MSISMPVRKRKFWSPAIRSLDDLTLGSIPIEDSKRGGDCCDAEIKHNSWRICISICIDHEKTSTFELSVRNQTRIP